MSPYQIVIFTSVLNVGNTDAACTLASYLLSPYHLNTIVVIFDVT